MRTYCFRCGVCGDTQTARHPLALLAEPCVACDEGAYRRDYRAENVGIDVSLLRMEREHSKEKRAAMMLPSNEQFKSPSDPDGTKGMRAWRESVTPDSSNKKPHWPGEVERKTF